MDGSLMENLIQMDDLGEPLFSETSTFIYKPFIRFSDKITMVILYKFGKDRGYSTFQMTLFWLINGGDRNH